jgi:hypothetical protein
MTMTELKTSDLLNDDALEAVAGGMRCPGPIIPTKTGSADPYNPIPFIPLGPFRW